jgi:hypothetical protein
MYSASSPLFLDKMISVRVVDVWYLRTGKINGELRLCLQKNINVSCGIG